LGGECHGGFDLNPDFQRGHVWTIAQQQHFIENVLRGIVTQAGLSVQFNCPNWENFDYQGDLPPGLQCIDGLQRITAILNFLAGEIRPFGLTVRELDDSVYSMRRSIFRISFAVHHFESKSDLLKHYLDLNTGGTPHSQAEIDRVHAMLAESDKAEVRGQ
jgi:hypothetical protein